MATGDDFRSLSHHVLASLSNRDMKKDWTEDMTHSQGDEFSTLQ